MAAWRVGVLGPVTLHDTNGRTVDLAGKRKRALLAMFVLRRGRPVPTAVLAEAVWHGSPPATAATALRVHVAELRKALAIGGNDLAQGLVTDEGGYVLKLAEPDSDTGVFEMLVNEARDSQDADARFRSAGDALQLWRGAPYPELVDTDLAAGEVGHLEQLRTEAFSLWAAAGLGAGRAAELIGPLESEWAIDRFHEDVARLLMLALYAVGRQVDALNIYQQTRLALLDDPGLIPGPALREAERVILAHEVEPEEQTTVPRPRRAARGAPLPHESMIGRDSQRARLADMIRRGRIVTIVGAPGAGKTRLALDVATGVDGALASDAC